MKINPTRLLLAAVASAALFCQSAGATSYLIEQFNYSSSGRLGDSSSGGAQTYPALWNGAQNTTTYTNGSGSLIGTNLGLVASAGDKVNLLGRTNGAVGGVVSITPASPQNGCYSYWNQVKPLLDPRVTTNLYTSFLYQFKNGYDLTNGNVLVQMDDVGGGIQSSSGQRSMWQLLGRWTGSQIQLGIAKCIYNTVAAEPAAGANVGITNWDSTLVSPGQTFFVVVRMQLQATNTTGVGGNFQTNIEDDLWINPAPATFGVAEGSVPTPDTNSPVGDGYVYNSTSGPGRFFICDTYAVGWLDELRIASTWAEVTPYFGQCLPVEITTEPATNVTQSAEIPAIINCGYVGTSATNQWQISKNSGATWTNIPNATLPTLITGNLQYPGDNLNEYRCLVGNSCDTGSSETSTVETVILTPTTPTPAGNIMNDPFTGLVFQYPVTPVNSVWFSVLDANQNPQFSDYPGPGATATTISNSSTLYVGYFVNTNALPYKEPVDLAIGSSIQVTFPFTPNDFSQFTGNGALRFGLYDYADLGVPITTSSTSLTGSAGQGYGVMGYMLSLDFGTNFTTTTPLSLYARNSLLSPALASTTGDYLSLSSGPTGGVNTNVPSFQDGVSNTLIFTVTRIATNECAVAVTITNANGLNISYSSVDTTYGWHRFDSFVLRPNSGVSSCANFFIPSFKVDLFSGITVVPTSISITNVSLATNSITLGWQALPAGGTYGYSVLATTNLSSGPWVTNVAGITTNTYTDVNTTTNNLKLFYRVSSP